MIFYEEEYARELLKSGFSSFMNFRDLSLLAKYFKYIGKNKEQIKKSLIEFCMKHNPDFNEVLGRKKIEDAIKSSEKYGIRYPLDVNVTESELEKIKSCGNHNRQKILFVMLVIAKYFKYNDTRLLPKTAGRHDGDFYANESFINILKMAKVNVSKTERIQIQYDLQQLCLISSIGSGSFQVNFVDEDSNISIIVNDMNNLIDFYPFYCEQCGKVAEKIGKRHNLCLGCYQENLRIRKTETMRRLRHK